MHLQVAVLVLISGVNNFAKARQDEPLIIKSFVGTSVDVLLPRHRNITIHRRSSALAAFQISRDGKILRITPKFAGTGSFIVRDLKTGKLLTQYLLSVSDPSLLIIQEEVTKRLSEISGIAVSIAGGRVVVDGQVISSSQISRIHSVAKMFGDKVRSLVTMAPESDRKLAAIIEREIGNPDVRVRIVNGHILTEGIVNTPAEAQRAEVIANVYAPNIVIEDATVDKKIIKLHPN